MPPWEACFVTLNHKHCLSISDVSFPIIRITEGPYHHFFGYYDKSPWDIDGKRILALEVPFMERLPKFGDKATIGVILTTENFTFMPITVTNAWNWQQGCMLQWLPGKRDHIIYNDFRDGRFVSIVMDIESGDRYVLPSPIYAVSHDGRKALTLNFERLSVTRPGYGYVGALRYKLDLRAPKDDGVFLLDIENGDVSLILSLADLAKFKVRPDMKNAVYWFNHLLFNPNDERFIFLFRWSAEIGGPRKTRLFTSDIYGDDIYLVSDDDMTSHFDWRDGKHILAWARKKEIGDRYFLFKDKTQEFEVVGEGLLTSDGHCSFSPDRRWILTDTYPDKNNIRKLILYNVSANRLFVVGQFYSIPWLKGEIRCDLHPRWSRDGRQICIDSTHEGSRQMYVIDVSDLTR